MVNVITEEAAKLVRKQLIYLGSRILREVCDFAQIDFDFGSVIVLAPLARFDVDVLLILIVLGNSDPESCDSSEIFFRRDNSIRPFCGVTVTFCGYDVIISLNKFKGKLRWNIWTIFGRANFGNKYKRTFGNLKENYGGISGEFLEEQISVQQH